MPRTDSEHLTELLTIRDQLVDAIGSAFAVGAPVKRYRIGTREVEREDLKPYLAWVREEIAVAQSTVNAASASARNYARLRMFR